MPARITVAIDDGALGRRMAAVRRRASDLRPLMQEAGEALLRSTRRRFVTMTAPDGTPWRPLAPSTLRRKKRNREKILTERTRLRGSLAYQASADAVEVGTSVGYAAIHQFGGTIEQPGRAQTLAFNGKGRFLSRKAAARRRTAVRVAFARVGGGRIEIPARPFLGLSAADLQTLERITERFLRRLGEG